MNQDGRTIIEVLVAMAIASVVSLSLLSIITLGLRFSRTSQYEDQRVYPVRNAIDMIVKDLRLTQGAYPNCGSTGRLALAVHGPAENDMWFLHYHRNGDLLKRTAYRDASCSVPLFEETLAYQITDFALTHAGAGKFTLRIQAQSNDPDSTPFELEQTIVGRVMAQP